jgi:hypothetical protein
LVLKFRPMLDTLTDENRSEALTILQDFSAQIARANAPYRLALTVAVGKSCSESSI